MIDTDIVIIGAGPAGLMAASYAARMGAQVLLLERSTFLGGQLVKQTHRVFLVLRRNMLVNEVLILPRY